MKLVDRLIFKAEKAANAKTDKPIHAFITFDRERGVFVSKCTFWNGVVGSGSRDTISEHKTLLEAEQAADKIVEDYDSSCPVIILCRKPAV